MAWNLPITWSSVVVTAAQMNAQIRDNLSILKTPIADDGGLIDDVAVQAFIASNTITFNLSAGRTFTFQATSNITTTTIQNVPSGGKNAWFLVRVEGDGSARAWTFFDSIVSWGSSIVPTRTVSGGKFDWFLFMSLNGGTTWHGFVMDQNFV